MKRLRNMWFPWTCHWQDRFDPRFFVRLRWKIVQTHTFTIGAFICAYRNLKIVWFNK